MIGQVFGRLTVESYHGKNRFGHKIWLCRCACGNIKAVVVNSLRSGATTSCGCYQREWSSEKHTTHGFSGTRLYAIWKNMLYRCYDTNCPIYARWGGKGVTVCNAWRFDYKSFHDWALASGYRDDLTIDRWPNNKGNYEPSNCRWATPAEQARNRSATKLIEDDARAIRSDPRPNTIIAEEYGVSVPTIQQIKGGHTWRDI